MLTYPYYSIIRRGTLDGIDEIVRGDRHQIHQIHQVEYVKQSLRRVTVNMRVRQAVRKRIEIR